MNITESKLFKQKQLTFRWNQQFKDGNSRGNDRKRKKWTENHRPLVAIYDVPIEEIEKRIIKNHKRERSRWCWARRKKNSDEIRRRKTNPRNEDRDEEEKREGERRKEERI